VSFVSYCRFISRSWFKLPTSYYENSKFTDIYPPNVYWWKVREAPKKIGGVFFDCIESYTFTKNHPSLSNRMTALALNTEPILRM
jgi:hypothetical protein